jgi:predicted MPP superfamily phosphohydrolase
MKGLAGVVAIGIVAALLLGAIGYREAVSVPIVRHERVPLPDWPAGAPPVRIALLSDVHIGSVTMSPARLASVVAEVNAQRPDLILIAGDFVNGHEPGEARADLPPLTTALRALHAPMGTVAVLGNHDHWTGAGPAAAALRAANITVLANRAVRRGPLTIVGIDDAASGHARPWAAFLAARNLGGAKIALTHSPDILSWVNEAWTALALAGHTHCGQVVLPSGRGLVSTSPFTGQRLYDPRYRCGVVCDGRRTTIVTAGVGSGSAPVRLGAPPDIWVVAVGPRT